MIDTAPRPDASLLEFLAARARLASDERLVAYAGGGFVLALVLLFWNGPGWELLLSASVCCSAFGVWGITDRELREMDAPGVRSVVALALLRVSAAIVGFVAFAFFAIALLGRSLGRIIS
jgi:hypothetical protein